MNRDEFSKIRKFIRGLCEARDGVAVANIVQIALEEVEDEIEERGGTTKVQEQILMNLRDASEDLSSIFERGPNRDPAPREREHWE